MDTTKDYKGVSTKSPINFIKPIVITKNFNIYLL